MPKLDFHANTSEIYYGTQQKWGKIIAKIDFIRIHHL